MLGSSFVLESLVLLFKNVRYKALAKKYCGASHVSVAFLSFIYGFSWSLSSCNVARLVVWNVVCVIITSLEYVFLIWLNCLLFFIFVGSPLIILLGHFYVNVSSVLFSFVATKCRMSLHIIYYFRKNIFYRMLQNMSIAYYICDSFIFSLTKIIT